MRKLHLEHYILLGLCGFLLALAVTIDYHRVVDYLFSDEAVYYMMAQSLAFDRDMEYTQHDLQRVYEEGWQAGPQGVYLTKADDGKIYYGKYLTYSLFLAPFIAAFGLKGFLILNAVLLCLMIWLGWLYLRQFNPQNISLLVAITFFLLSASFVYTFWLTPETFNMFCVTFGLFLWLYRRETRVHEGPTYRHMVSLDQARHEVRSKSQKKTVLPLFVRRSLRFLEKGYRHVITFIKWLMKSPNGRLYLAPIPIALASASKISNILFLAPIFVDVLFTEDRRPETEGRKESFMLRLLPIAGKALALCLVFGVFVGAFFGLQYLLTGNINQYAGDRKMFIWNFPFNSPDDVWDQGIRHSNVDYFEQSFFFNPKTLLYNIYYYMFGRFTGMFPYFICSFLAVYYFVRQALARTLSPFRKMELLRRSVLLLTIVASIAAFIVMAPINYHGGSGAFGNRFFLNIYPAFLFLITIVSKKGEKHRIPGALVISWIIGSLFLAQALLNPFQSSYYPAAQAFKFPYRFLPVELTMINALPTHVNPHLMQAADDENPPYRLYFVDENVTDLRLLEFWVKGEQTSEFVVLAYEPQSHLVVTITNGPIANRVDVSVAGTTQSIQFNALGETKRLVFPLTWSMPYFDASLYPVRIQSQTGFISKFTEGIHLEDRRYLGCQVSLSLNPLEAGKVYLEHDQPQEALTILESAIEKHPDDIQLRYYLGVAYQRAGMAEAAIDELERCTTLLPDFQEKFLSDCYLQSDNCPPETLTSSTMDTDTDSDLAQFLSPLTWTYEAEGLFRNTGNVIAQFDASNGEVVVFDPIRDTPEFLVYGPYVEFPAGQYQVRYRIKVGNPYDSSLPSGAALFFDVFSLKHGMFLKRDSVFVEEGEYSQSEEYRDYTLNFEIDYPATLEFRVETTGYTQVTVDRIDIYPRLPLQIYEAFAQAKNNIQAYEDAYSYLQQLIEVDPWTPKLQIEYLQTLLNLERWDTALQFVKSKGGFSDAHTGLVTYLDPHLSNFSHDLPESLVRFHDEVYANFVPETPLEHHFGDTLTLMGYDVDAEDLAPGDHFSIQYYWKSLKSTNENYAIFVHFIKKKKILTSETISKIKRKLGIGNIEMFQQDHHPLHGAYPTSKWLANECIREQYEIVVPPEIEPGTYEIWIGVWNPFTEIRLKTDKGKTKVEIGEIKID